MRRLVLLFLIVLMPLQWSWAAAASICQHETTASAAHPGHHMHEHAAPAATPVADDTASAGNASPAAVDADCGVCHVSCSSALLAALSPLAVPHAAPQAFATVDAVVAGRFIDTPVRPPRSPAA